MPRHRIRRAPSAERLAELDLFRGPERSLNKKGYTALPPKLLTEVKRKLHELH